ncbi:MAG: acyl-CoA dehydratase activase [Desulfatiglandaceae bacterium]
MTTVGIDCGAKTTKTVILRDGQVIGKGKVLTGFDQGEAISESLGQALGSAGVSREEIRKIAGTGSRVNAIKIADTQINDSDAMAKAANYFFPNSRTVVDVGAEEGRAAKIDANGNVLDFAVNEECAAGAGVFIETMARALEVTVEEMGRLALKSAKKIPMNAQCAVFAESEVVGLIHAKTDKTDISRAIHDAMAGRIVSMIRQVGVHEDVVMIGGVARNPGLVELMKKELHLENLLVPDDPEFGTAVGAAVVAAEVCLKGR